jgi:N4-gp56 family major capsid protein
VAEHGFAIAVSELLLNASFDDVMASASRLLGRNMALYLDGQARDTLLLGTSVLFGYQPATVSTAQYGAYAPGTKAANRAALTGDYYLSPHAVKDTVETLATKNVPRLGETYVMFVHPHQSRRLRDHPEFIEVTKYAAPGNFMLGEIGRLYDTVFIETTQVTKILGGTGDDDVYQAIAIGDNAFGHAISLPVELRDGGILDFGREHALAWYAIWGLGKITDNAIVIVETN